MVWPSPESRDGALTHYHACRGEVTTKQRSVAYAKRRRATQKVSSGRLVNRGKQPPFSSPQGYERVARSRVTSAWQVTSERLLVAPPSVRCLKYLPRQRKGPARRHHATWALPKESACRRWVRRGPLRLHVVDMGRRSGAHKRPRYPEDACRPHVRGGSRAGLRLRRRPRLRRHARGGGPRKGPRPPLGEPPIPLRGARGRSGDVHGLLRRRFRSMAFGRILGYEHLPTRGRSG